MKKILCLLLMLLAVSCAVSAAADQTETVLFQGEKKGKFINFNNWKDVVSINLAAKKVDMSVFEQPFDVLVTYEST